MQSRAEEKRDGDVELIQQAKQAELPDDLAVHAPGDYKVIRRNGTVTSFDKSKIMIAMTRAFIAVEGGGATASTRVHDLTEKLTRQVVDAVTRRISQGGTIGIEDIQDQVELALMREGEHKVARSYVLYREKRASERKSEATSTQPDILLHVTDQQGKRRPLDREWLLMQVEEACRGLTDVTALPIVEETIRGLFDGVKEEDVSAALVMSARTHIEQEPNYNMVAARLLLDSVRKEALSAVMERPTHLTAQEMTMQYPAYFEKYVLRAVGLRLLDGELLRFDLAALGAAIKPKRDYQFGYLGLQTLYDRYFVHTDGTRLELPQAFFMRVAMGLAINEKNHMARAIEFYELLSSFDFMSSTPTLFNSGTLRPQLSSCYLSTVPDNLHGIYGVIQDNAMLSKYAGGLGNDWTPVRAMGAHIQGTNGKSQGIVPFLKVANDTAVAVNQGGKRKGALCSYLETWHLDIEEFLELRKNTGDDRRRTHDMHTANWIPDLFMQRVCEEGDWTLFSPDEVPGLHDCYGKEFTKRYTGYEAMAKRGEIRSFKKLSALDLWRRMLTMLYETGHPWITFKDPCNLRSPQAHAGTVHCSNLCTEITLNTSEDEIAVCNLGSVNLAQHMKNQEIDTKKLEQTIKTAIRMLDNVIDYNYYSVPQAKQSNLRHRPIGLGIMGFQDSLYKMGIAYGSEEAVLFADRSMEMVSYFAIKASSDLADKRGCYPSFPGSLWSQGVLPIDSMNLLQEQRDGFLETNFEQTMDWDALRQKVKTTGMRNSNCLAIAPTATISNICGVSQSIEPTYQNLFVKSNLSGEFTVVNPYLVRELKARNLWDEVMVSDLKYFDGNIAKIDRIPDELKRIYATAFEIDPRWLVEAAARRQKWIDQSQSLNLYLAEPDGKKLDNLYKLAWIRGLKTTYYLRSKGATQIERSTLSEGRESKLASVDRKSITELEQCAITDPTCEACQ